MKWKQGLLCRTLLCLLACALISPVCAQAQEVDGMLISDCASGWHCDGGAVYSKNTSDTTDDNACSVAKFTTKFFFFLVHTNAQGGGTFDMTDAQYICMDIWTDDVNVFRNASDCRMDIGPDANVDAWNVKVKAATLRSLELEEGWNRVYLKLDGIEHANYDLTKANVIRFYAIGLSDQQREIRIDNMWAVAEIPPQDRPTEAVKTQASYYTFNSDNTKLSSPAAMPRPGVIAQAPQPAVSDENNHSEPTSSSTANTKSRAWLIGGIAAATAVIGAAAAVVLSQKRKGGKAE